MATAFASREEVMRRAISLAGRGIGSVEPNSCGLPPFLKYSPMRAIASSVGVSRQSGIAIPNSWAHHTAFCVASKLAMLTNVAGSNLAPQPAGVVRPFDSVWQPTRYWLSRAVNVSEVTVFTAWTRVR